VALAPWGTAIGARARWRPFEHDFEGLSELLAKPLRAAEESVSSRDGGSVVLERARHLERDVLEAALVRFPERDILARALAHAAFVDCVWRNAALAARSNPVTPLRELWSAGYVLAAMDDDGVSLAIPPL
jgi:hypothetical protein